MVRDTTILAWAILAAGCAVNGGAKEPVTAFDGDYITSYVGASSAQWIDGVQLDCEPLTESLFIRVRDGVASGYLERDENYSFRSAIGRDGTLEAVIPIDSYYQYDVSKPVENANLLLIFNTQFSSMGSTGVIAVGDRRLGFKGCSTDVELQSL